MHSHRAGGVKSGVAALLSCAGWGVVLSQAVGIKGGGGGPVGKDTDDADLAGQYIQ